MESPYETGNTSKETLRALRSAVDESLAAYIYPNAIFVAERLYAADPSLSHLHLLAHCYYVSGDAATACRLLREYNSTSTVKLDGEQPIPPGTSLWDCAYLFGVVSCVCGLYRVAERVLVRLHSASPNATCAYWLGVCSKHLHRDNAGTMFADCCTRAPQYFTAYEEHLQCSDPHNFVNPYGVLENSAATATAASTGGGGGIGSSSSTGGGSYQQFGNAQSFNAPFDGSSVLTESTNAIPTRYGVGGGVGSSIPRSSLSAVGDGTALYGGAFSATHNAPSLGRFASSRQPSMPSRLAGFAAPHVATEPSAEHAEQTNASSYMALVAAYLRPFAQVSRLLNTYKCVEALDLVRSVRFPERNSGWTLATMAMAMLHHGNVLDSRQYFSQLRECEPWRLNDPALVHYSTVLWRLRAEGALGHLSQVLVNEMPVSAVTLCVVANCYSLAKEPKQALCMLIRAGQVDPTFAYAHTLRGYELLSLNQIEEAQAAFNDALRIDGKQYIAYAGLGELNARVEEDNQARMYFQRAIAINPLPTITNRLAETYHRHGASEEFLRHALRIYTASLDRHPNNFTGRLKRADVLLRLCDYDTAYKELAVMQVECPGEAMVYITLAKCLQLMGDVQRAIQAYHKAMDLDPRRATFITQCLNKISADENE